MSETKFNPWRSMWVKPRDTIRTIARENPRRSLWTLAFVYGLTSLLNGFQSVPIAMQIGLLPTLLIALILAPLWGYVAMSIWSYVIVLVGKIFKGQATFQTARAAYAWSCVPLLGNIPIWCLMIFFYANMLFFGMQGQMMLSGPMMLLLFILSVGKLVFAVWSLVIYLVALAEVQNFSVMCAIGTTILTGILIGVVVWVLWIIGFEMGQPAIASIDWKNMRSIVQYLQ